jgi:hypothetical protein
MIASSRSSSPSSEAPHRGSIPRVSTWILVWLALTLLSIVALAAILIGLVRQAFVLSRSLSRFTEEVGPLATEIGRQTDHVAGHGADRPRIPRS